MPLVPSSYTRRPFYLLNSHLETIVPSLFYRIREPLYQREQLELPDGDFLNIDWIRKGNRRCLILSHGLEGDTERYYIKRAARYFRDRGWDIAAWNCRSCGGEMNRLPRFYHHGDTADLDVVVQKALSQYNEVVLIGYSMGGSISLKYLGERTTDLRIKGAVVFSVPCNLRDSAEQLLKRENRFYEKRFLNKLLKKIQAKALMFPEEIRLEKEILDFDLFHDLYTAPLHGFKDKAEFFAAATCDQYLPQISVPVLIVNAGNDPMLGEACYPTRLAERSTMVHLEVPEVGGHAGFSIAGRPYSYMELRAESFIREVLKIT